MEVARAGPGAEGRSKKRTGTSKYDFFKVKVWLGENMDHYYVLSRFLICRMLTVTKIPYIKAVKIALETKKYLVDNNLQDVTQAELENVLFSIIRSKGFDEQYIDCYRMVTQFYQQRQPLCIIICGTAWTGKSTIAQQLASRINIPNVMQTDVIYELLRAGGDSPLQPQPLWCRPGLSDAALVGEFRREARVVRKGMDGDLVKTLSDGKPIIIEGMHLDPGLYIQDFGRRGIIMLPARPAAAISPPRTAAAAAGRSPARGSSSAQSPGRPAAAGYRRSMTTPPRRGPAAAATAVAAADADPVHGAGSSNDLGSSRQQAAACQRSMSADGVATPVRPAAAATARLAATLETEGSASSRDEAATDEEQRWQQQQEGQAQQFGNEGWQQRQQQQQQQQSGDGALQRHQRQQQRQQDSQLLHAEDSQHLHGADVASAPRGSSVLDSACMTGTADAVNSCSTTALKHQPAGLVVANSSNSGSSRDVVLPSSTTGSAAGGLSAVGSNNDVGSRPLVPARPPGNISSSSLCSGSVQQVKGDEAAAAGRNLDSLEPYPTGAGAAAWAAQAAGKGAEKEDTATADMQGGSCGAAAAAMAGLHASPSHFGPTSPSTPPAVVMLDELQVCAATAQALALQQHRQQCQQPQQQQQGWPHRQQYQQQLGLMAPGSPYSSADSEGGPAGVSPGLSQEHSTTEVVSRQPSCCSPLLSQEPSAAELGAGDDSALGLLGEASPLNGGIEHGFGTTVGQQQQQSRQDLQQGVLQDVQQEGLTRPLQEISQQQQQQAAGMPLPRSPLQRQARPNTQQQLRIGQVVKQLQCHQEQDPAATSEPDHTAFCNGAVADSEPLPTGTVTSNGLQRNGGTASWAALSEGVPVEIEPMLQQLHDSAAAADGKHHVQQQQQQHRVCQLSAQPVMAPSAEAAAQPSHLEGDSHSTSGSRQADASLHAPVAAASPPPAAAAAASGPKSSSAEHAAVPEPKQQQQQQQQRRETGSSTSSTGPRSGTQQDSESVQRPLFVPILVYMDEADHVLMQEEALPHYSSCCSSSSSAVGTGRAGAAAAVTAAQPGSTTSTGAAGCPAPSSETSAAAKDLADPGSSSKLLAAGGDAGGSTTGSPQPEVSGPEALRRMRLLQEYLCAYEAQGLPVVKVSYGNFGEALDKLHEYILQCIKCAQAAAV